MVILSIVIPTYQRPDMLAECLEALLSPAEHAHSVEIIVIDNDPAESARDTVDRLTSPALRYVPETRRGVVNARNRGIDEARGRFVAFIDDDEVPRPGWLDAVLRHTSIGVQASFGPVIPRFEQPQPRGLEAMLADLYTRDLKRRQDADVSDAWAYVGTGNSLFDKQLCFPDPDPFDARFNGSGGEDVWLIKSLLARGIRLSWNPAAKVEEIVPVARATAAYVRERKFRHGQQRVIFVRGKGGASGWARVALWMGVGAIQFGGYGAALLALKLVGLPRHEEMRVRASGGLGKLLWWRGGDQAYAA